MTIRITPEDDQATRAATLAAVEVFQKLAGPTYAKIGCPLETPMRAADALLGGLIEGMVQRYGAATVTRILAHTIDMGKHFQQAGTYRIQWMGKAFQSPEFTFRVIDRKKK